MLQLLAFRLVSPWRDRNGRFSALKAVTLAVCVAPALWIAYLSLAGGLGAEPLVAAQRELGRWSVRFLLITLAVTPIRRVGRFSRVQVVRRMLGVTAFAYLALHFGLYVVQEHFEAFRIAREIVLRFYLTIGFVAFLGLGALAATSTDRMIRRLGRRWPQLHKLVYPLTAVGLLHDLLQAKRDLDQATLMVGLYFWLMAYRLMVRQEWGVKPMAVLGLGIVTTAFTASFEAAWYGLATGLNGFLVLGANLTPEFSIRPAHWAALAALVPVILAYARRTTAATAAFTRDASPTRTARPSV